jgi:hypothetical protein
VRQLNTHRIGVVKAPNTQPEPIAPFIANGIALHRIHHAAFDSHLTGIDPGGVIHLSERLLALPSKVAPPSWAWRFSRFQVRCAAGRSGGVRAIPAASLGGLVLAVNEGERLVNAGRVGTGWDRSEARELLRLLEPRRRERSPLAVVPRELRRGVIWVEPELVADVQYLHWKERSQLRHASYQGLREDRDPRSVVAEVARP